jgi:hypothetical protein
MLLAARVRNRRSLKPQRVSAKQTAARIRVRDSVGKMFSLQQRFGHTKTASNSYLNTRVTRMGLRALEVTGR